MTTTPKNVFTYLEKFSDGQRPVEANDLSNINNVVVIPAIAEYDNLPVVISSLEKNRKKNLADTLILFVINNSESSSLDVKENNFRSIVYLRNTLKEDSIKNKLRIGFIDASTSGNELNSKNAGVGLARKTGMDAALSIFDYSSDKKKIMLCLDADCIVSENYLETIINIFNERNVSAASIYFEHSIDQKSNTAEAIICYEIFLRYYVLGLKIAESPYAFETIGSSMACDYESYIKIGGMNKLKAAEDFYFLEKLSKVTKIYTIKDAVVYPSGRRSWRVPFGTGQRVGRYLDKLRDEYMVYDLNSFHLLKNWLTIFRDNDLNTKNYIDKARNISNKLADFLLSHDFENALNNIRINSKNDEQFSKQKNNWFDGFRTLKLIHHLRDNGFPQIKMFDALDKLFDYFDINKPERDANLEIPNFEIQKEYLFALRKLETQLD
jgi:hypothetical protein